MTIRPVEIDPPRSEADDVDAPDAAATEEGKAADAARRQRGLRLQLQWKLLLPFIMTLLVAAVPPRFFDLSGNVHLTFYLFALAAAAVLSSIYIRSTVVAALSKIIRSSETIGSGDLTRPVPADRRWTDDEIVDLISSINNMHTSLRELVGRIQSSSEATSGSAHDLSNAAEIVNDEAQEIAEKMEEIARGTARQHELAEKASQSVNSIAETIGTMLGSAREAAEAAARAEEASRMSRELTQATLDRMGTVFDQLNRSAEQVTTFDDRTAEIEKIVTLIQSIANQTNLLAVNAAIEAARAGEAGRGFAIVADEVRELADSSGDAAKQIARLVEDVKAEGRQISDFVRESMNTVEEGRGTLGSIGRTIERVGADIQSSSTQVREIRNLAEEARHASSAAVLVVESITDVARSNDTATRRVSQAIEQQSSGLQSVAAGAATLTELSRGMQTAAGRFRV